jgi:hypothetical protein
MNGFNNSLTAITTKYGLAAGAQEILNNSMLQSELVLVSARVAIGDLTAAEGAEIIASKGLLAQKEAEAAITTIATNEKFKETAASGNLAIAHGVAATAALEDAAAESLDAAASSAATVATWAYVKSKAALAS